MSRADFVEEVAPPAPPCFQGRRNWVLYLQAAAEADKPGRGSIGPLIVDNGVPVFNRAFRFCNDCDPRHKAAMTAAGRCRPNILREENVLVVKKLAPAPAQVTAPVAEPSRAKVITLVPIRPGGSCGIVPA